MPRFKKLKVEIKEEVKKPSEVIIDNVKAEMEARLLRPLRPSDGLDLELTVKEILNHLDK